MLPKVILKDFSIVSNLKKKQELFISSSDTSFKKCNIYSKFKQVYLQ